MLTRIINALAKFIKPPAYFYAIRCKRTKAWLVDVQHNGMALYDVEFGRSLWFDDRDGAYLGLCVAGLSAPDHDLMRLHVQPQSNIYAMKIVGW